MSAREKRGKSPARHEIARKGTDYDVGYGKPPRAHQFKAGRSGNPRGRPKSVKNEATILRELLNRRIEVREGGRSRTITVFEAILLRFTESALKGDTKSAGFVLNRYAAVEGGEPSVGTDLSPDDRAIVDAFVRRLEGQLGKEGKAQ